MPKPALKDRKYTREHEWSLDTGDGAVTVGITDYAQEMLTDIVFVELPDIGRRLRKMETLATVESVKSVSEIYAPVSGEVVAVNGELEEHPELINQDAYGKGWLVRLIMDDREELQLLMNAESYEAFIGQKNR